MPDNRSIVLGSTGVIVVAALLRLWPVSCPSAAEAAPDARFDDPIWGAANNLTIRHQPDGDVMEATPANGFHRVIKSVMVPVAGRYRLSVETAYAGASGFAMEVVNGPKYAFVAGNPATGQITHEKGDIVAAGADAVSGKPGSYRWWIEIDYVPGRADYNFAFSIADNRIFTGGDSCKIVMNNPSFERVQQ
jgi:hypothetical protein